MALIDPAIRRWVIGAVKPLRTLWTLIRRLILHEGMELAGHMAFTGLLSLFPFLIFIAALAGFLGDAAAADDFVNAMFDFLPKAVAGTLAPVVADVMTTQRGGLLTFGIIGTLWAASSGFEALRLGLNRAYEVAEKRPFWYRRLQDVLFVFGGAVLNFVLSVSIILGPIIWGFLHRLTLVSSGVALTWNILRYGFATAVLTIALLILYRALPNARPTFREILPGALVTACLWLVAASLFSLYLQTIANYSVTYGSLGGVIVTLLFFYISAVIFLFGGELIAYLCKRQSPEACDVETPKPAP